ncbi:MAG: hypothetical protein IVW57_06330 [Ktedonobacterales bacterium]|nr:hypothetical protein [Ktedonobacterales bacterium]
MPSAREKNEPRGIPQAADAPGAAAGVSAATPAAPEARALLGIGALIGLFLVALAAVAPLGGISLSISPLARAWPWLLLPARALFGNALVDGSVPPQRGWPELALFSVLLVGASCAAALAPLRCLRQSGSDRRHLALALGGAAVLGGILLLLPALPSDDIFSYILYGRISAVHHANPLVAVPASFPNDPFLTLVFWRTVRSVYGPVWLLLSSGLSLLAQALGGGLVAYVLLFKLLGLSAHLLNTLLIWGILGILAPRRRLLGTLLYAWNPLCLLEFVASGHNDAVMLTFLLLAVYAFVREWEVAGLVALGLSISIKYVPLALLPLYLALVARRLSARGVDWSGIARALTWRLGLLVGVLAVTALPYWAGAQTLSSLLYSPPAQSLNNSLLEGISWPLRWLAQGLFGLSASGARTLVDTLLKVGALLVFLGLWLREFRRARDLDGLLIAWGWILVWYALVASGWFWPWYVTWAVAVVALVPWGTLPKAALLLAGGSLTLYAFLPLHSAPIYGYRGAVAFGPVLVYLLWLLRARWQAGWRPLPGARRAARLPVAQAE